MTGHFICGVDGPLNCYRANETQNSQSISMAWLRKQTIPTERLPHVSKLVPTFVDRGCHVVSILDPYSRILGFLDWSHYFFFQVAPQL
jgi:hypothetical protein